MQVNHPAEVTRQDTHALQWWQDWAHRINSADKSSFVLFACNVQSSIAGFYSPWQVRHGLYIQIAAMYGPDPVFGCTASSLETIQEW